MIGATAFDEIIRGVLDENMDVIESRVEELLQVKDVVHEVRFSSNLRREIFCPVMTLSTSAPIQITFDLSIEDDGW